MNIHLKAGGSDDLSKEAVKVMKATKQTIVIFIVPDQTVMRKAPEGPPTTKQYRMIVSEMKASTKNVHKSKRKATATNQNSRGTKMPRG